MPQVVYLLKLQHGCFYVGKTTDVGRRVQEHHNGSGASWTKTHKPLSYGNPVWTKPVQHILDEDYETEKLMMQEGIDKVRGGTYSQVVLPDHEREVLKKKFRCANDKCFKCGKPGHFVADCPSGSPSASQVMVMLVSGVLLVCIFGPAILFVFLLLGATLRARFPRTFRLW